jgi:hypothetical protein
MRTFLMVPVLALGVATVAGYALARDEQIASTCRGAGRRARYWTRRRAWAPMGSLIGGRWLQPADKCLTGSVSGPSGHLRHYQPYSTA